MRISKNVAIIEHYGAVEVLVWNENTHRTERTWVKTEKGAEEYAKGL